MYCRGPRKTRAITKLVLTTITPRIAQADRAHHGIITGENSLLSFSELHLSRDGPEDVVGARWTKTYGGVLVRGRRGLSGVGPLESESCESGGPLSFSAVGDTSSLRSKWAPQ